jgi:hypothetical protein
VTNTFRFSVLIGGERLVFDAHRHANETQPACQLRALNAFQKYWHDHHELITDVTFEWIA